MVDDLVVGQVVRSRAGRDSGRFMMIVHIEDGFVYLADGRVRKANKPKRKKMKHIAKTNYIVEGANELLKNIDSADAFLRNALKKYNDSNESEGEKI